MFFFRGYNSYLLNVRVVRKCFRKKMTANFHEITKEPGRLTKRAKNCPSHELDNFTSGAVGRNIII